MDLSKLTYRLEVEGADRTRSEARGVMDDVERGARSSADGVERSFGDGAAGRLFGGVGKGAMAAAGAIGAAFAGGQLLQAGAELFSLGQELDVYDKKTTTVFEGSADLVRAWADKNNEAMGLSDEALAGLAAGFGDLLKPMGFTASQAAMMSTDVVGLSGALSAWSGNKRTAAEVSEILAKAMLGERDGLKELGISISEADVSARLAANGQDKLTGAALQQAQAMATQQLIMEKSTDAQKAWANGSMDGIKSTNSLRAAWDDLKAGLADRLMPVAAKVTSWLASEAVPWVERLVAKGSALWNEWGPRIAATFSSLWEKAAPVFDAIRQGWDLVVGLFRQGADQVGDRSTWLGATIDKVRGVFASAWGAIQAIIQTGVTIVTYIWTNFGDLIVRYISTAWENIQSIVGGALDILGGLFDLIKSVLTGKWGEAWDAIKRVLSGAWDIIVGVLRQAWNVVSTIFLAIGRAISEPLSAAWDWVRGAFTRGVEFVTGIPGRIWSALGGLWNIISNGATIAWGAVSTVWDTMVGWVSGLPGRVGSAASGMWDGIKNAFRSAINWIIDKWNGLSFTLPSVDLPGLGKIGGYTLSTPNIPRLADGGIVQYRPGGSLINVAEMGRDEALQVIPLSRYLDSPTGAGGGGGLTIGTVSLVNPDPSAIVAALIEWAQLNGSVPIQVATANALA